MMNIYLLKRDPKIQVSRRGYIDVCSQSYRLAFFILRILLKSETLYFCVEKYRCIDINAYVLKAINYNIID